MRIAVIILLIIVILMLCVNYDKENKICKENGYSTFSKYQIEKGYIKCKKAKYENHAYVGIDEKIFKIPVK